LEDPLPTTVMLSHVYELKDIKNAIKAAAVVVNKFHLSQYRLLVYGSLSKDVAYVSECYELIGANNIGEQVKLCGLGSPTQVLPRGWIFMNSSISEGLPLALGEAGLTGLPVVATDVGGSFEVVSDLEDGFTFGRIVPPSDPSRLAVAQLEVFAMAGDLAQRVASAAPCQSPSSEPPLPLLQKDGMVALLQDPVALLQRIHRASTARRQLGMLFREHVLGHFTMPRYLREHRQSLWIGAIANAQGLTERQGHGALAFSCQGMPGYRCAVAAEQLSETSCEDSWEDGFAASMASIGRSVRASEAVLSHSIRISNLSASRLSARISQAGGRRSSVVVERIMELSGDMMASSEGPSNGAIAVSDGKQSEERESKETELPQGQGGESPTGSANTELNKSDSEDDEFDEFAGFDEYMQCFSEYLSEAANSGALHTTLMETRNSLWTTDGDDEWMEE